MNGRAKGYIGEQIAAEHLAKKGWKILARNIRECGVEVDLIALDLEVELQNLTQRFFVVDYQDFVLCHNCYGLESGSKVRNKPLFAPPVPHI